MEGTYEPSSNPFVREHVERFESSGGVDGGEMHGAMVIMLWTRGRSTGAVRKSPVIRVEDGGRYVAVASDGGNPRHPSWYLNVVASPEVAIQDGHRFTNCVASVLRGEVRQRWWAKAVEVFPPYEEYQQATRRLIPIVLLEPARNHDGPGPTPSK